MGGSVKRDRRKLHVEQSHVLHYQRIDAGTVEGGDDTAHVGQFVIVDYSVKSDIDAHAETMGKFDERGYVSDRV